MMAPTQETLRRRLGRYAIVATIFLVVFGIAAIREFQAEADGSVDTAQRLEVGEPAPNFTLEALDGTFRLDEALGDVVVVNFWASWCGPCRFEMPEFQALHRERGEAEGIRVVAVNLTASDSRTSALEFIEDYGLTFTIAWDETGGVAQHYGVNALPATFFIDRDGVLRSRSYGPVLGERLEENLRLAGAGVTGAGDES